MKHFEQPGAGVPESAPCTTSLSTKEVPVELAKLLTQGPAFLAQKLGELLSIDLSEPFDDRKASMLVRKLHTHVFTSPEESRRCAFLLDAFARHRWETRSNIFHMTDGDVDLRRFDGNELTHYEFMRDQIAGNCDMGNGKLEPVREGVVQNLLEFPQNALEADDPHAHFGGRIIYVCRGTATFNNGVRNGKRMRPVVLPEKTIYFMPSGLPHNFAAQKGGDTTVKPRLDVIRTGPGNTITAEDFLRAGQQGDVFISSTHIGWVHPDDPKAFMKIDMKEYESLPWEDE